MHIYIYIHTHTHTHTHTDIATSMYPYNYLYLFRVIKPRREHMKIWAVLFQTITNDIVVFLVLFCIL